MDGTKKIAIFASGSGSNAENIINYFRKTGSAEVVLILCNKKDAFVFQRAEKLQVPAFHFTRDQFYNSEGVEQLLSDYKIDLIVLAGFLWLIPSSLIKKYPNRIINIHPALLPKFGGKGMYGDFVHKSVIENKESETGITIHFANEHFDEGEILFQAKCKIHPSDNFETVAEKVHKLEYDYYPVIIEKVVKNL